MAGKTGVYPCYENQFTIKTGESTEVPIADMESFSVSIDGSVEEWKPYEAEGWVRRLMTGKSITISVSGKRNVGDAGNDYIAGLALKTGAEATSTLTWTFPSGDKLVIAGVVNVKEWGSGDSTNVAPLSFDFMSDGKPVFTAAV
ncbi:MAG: phage tail tube protein [Oscillospiraceae bacterium]